MANAEPTVYLVLLAAWSTVMAPALAWAMVQIVKLGQATRSLETQVDAMMREMARIANELIMRENQVERMRNELSRLQGRMNSYGKGDA